MDFVDDSNFIDISDFMDLNIKIKQDDQIIGIFGGKDANYDDIRFLEFLKIIKIIEKGFYSYSDLANKINAECDYLHELLEDPTDTVCALLDLDNNTITHTFFIEYEEICESDHDYYLIKKINNEYHIAYIPDESYDNDESFPLTKVSCDICELFDKEVLSFDEFKKLANYINYLLKIYNDDAYLINGTHLLKLIKTCI